MFTKTRSKAVLTLAAVAIGLTLTTAQAAIVTTATTNAAYNGLAVSNTDLLQDAGVVTTSVGYVPYSSFGTPDPVLTDGSAGGNTTASGDWPNVLLDVTTDVNNVNFSVTFDLDLSGAAAGYDLTSIETFTGWASNRAEQHYDVLVSTVGSAAFTPLVTVSVPELGNVGLRVALTEDTTGILASGVDSIRFIFSSPDLSVNNGSVWREIDVQGTATSVDTTIPTPAALPAGLALLGLAAMRRRR